MVSLCILGWLQTHSDSPASAAHHLLLFHFSFSEGLLHLSPFIPRSVCSHTPASLYLQHGIHSPIPGCSLSCLNYSGKHPYKQHLSELFRQPDDFFLLTALCKNIYLVKRSLAYAFPFLIFICLSWLSFCSVFTACLLAIRFSFPFLFRCQSAISFSVGSVGEKKAERK